MFYFDKIFCNCCYHFLLLFFPPVFLVLPVWACNETSQQCYSAKLHLQMARFFFHPRDVIPLAAHGPFFEATDDDSYSLRYVGHHARPEDGVPVFVCSSSSVRTMSFPCLLSRFTQFWNCLDWDLRLGLCHTHFQPKRKN